MGNYIVEAGRKVTRICVRGLRSDELFKRRDLRTAVAGSLVKREAKRNPNQLSHLQRGIFLHRGLTMSQEWLRGLAELCKLRGGTRVGSVV